MLFIARMEVLELVSIPFTQVEESVRHAKDVVPFADQAATCVAQTKYMASEHSIQVVLTSESQQRLGTRLEGGSDREGGDPDVELGPFRKVCDGVLAARHDVGAACPGLVWGPVLNAVECDGHR